MSIFPEIKAIDFKTVRKTLVAVATGVSSALALGLLGAPYDEYAVVALSVLGSVGVYAVSNKTV